MNQVEIDDFRPTFRYISETVQDSVIVTIWNTNKNAYALYRMALFPVTLSDPNYPNHPLSIIFVAIRIFVVGRDKDFKFGTLVDRSKS